MSVDLEELEQLAKAATPGPWEDRGIGLICQAKNKNAARIADCIPVEITSAKQLIQLKVDAEYIVAACNAVPSLIARIRELESRLQECVCQLEDIAHEH